MVFFSNILIFLKNFQIFKNEKIFLIISWILNEASKHKTPTNFKKFKHFSRKIVKILNFFLLKFLNFLNNILIIFLRNRNLFKKYSKFYNNVFRSPNFSLNSFSTLNIKNSKILIILSTNLIFSPAKTKNHNS